MFLKIFSIFYFLIASNLSFAASTLPDLGVMFHRLVTRGSLPSKHLDAAYYNAYLHHHWSKQWQSAPLHHFKYGQTPEPHVQFYQELFTRFEKAKKDGAVIPISSITSKSINKNSSPIISIGDPRVGHPKVEPFILKEAKRGFIEGHLIPFEYTTTYPYVLITAFARNTLEKPGVKYLKWFAPFEQALACNTFGEYRRRIALLKDWDAYSAFALTVIPAGADISYYFGPVAPQHFPQFDFTSATDFNFFDTHPHVRKVGNFISKHNRELTAAVFYESLNGGATQLFIRSVSEFDIYDVTDGILCPINKAPRQITYEIRDTNGDWHETDSTRPCHLIDNSYDQSIIDLHGQLFKWSIITQEEYNSISDTLNFVAKKLGKW